MPEKIKITKAELAELYDIIDETEESRKVISEINDDGKTATFEEYTEIYDKAEEKKFRDET